MKIEEMVSKILELIKEKKIREIKKELANLEEIDIAEVMNELPLDSNLLLVFRLLDKDMSTEIFANLDSEEQEYIINSITDKEISTIIEDLFTDDAVDMLEEMPATVVKRVLKNATPDTRNLINQFLKYPDSSAGSVMTSEFVDLKSNMTVSEAVDHLRKVAEEKETIYTCYVTDKTRILEGVVSIKDLLLAHNDDLLKDIMEKDIISAHTLDDQEAVAQDFAKYDLIALPVLDNEERLVGIITIDDIVDVMTEEATEDIMKMNAIVPTEDPYLKTSAFKIAKSRIVWLMILMFTSIISGLILEKFEDAIAALPFLVAFIPMLMDSGGNAGSQASTTIIRGLATNEITLKDCLKVAWKEIRVALMVGLVLCTFMAGRIFIQYHLIHQVDGGPLKLIFAVTGAMLATITAAKLVGSLLPMLAKKVHLDPAIVAAPMLTTIVDATALTIFFLLVKAMYQI